MIECNHAKLAAIALDLIEDLQRLGFGRCGCCVDEDTSQCQECGGDPFGRPVNGGDCVEMMGRYFNDLAEAAGMVDQVRP